MKHPLDWYIDNTPQDNKDYEKGCLGAFVIAMIILIIITAIFLII